MTAFNIEVLLLLLLAFLLGLGLGLWLRRFRQRAADAHVMVSVPAHLPPAQVKAAMSDDAPAVGEPAPASSAAEETPAQPEPARPAATEQADAVAPSPLRSPVADLFGHLLNVPPGAVPDEPEAEPEPPRRSASAVVRERENHPGVPPPVLEAPEGGVADDLKRLKGIGPQNERRLHALGIFHFRQIAAWSADEVLWVGSYLAFPGRIEREDWIGQARTLADAAPPADQPGAES